MRKVIVTLSASSTALILAVSMVYANPKFVRIQAHNVTKHGKKVKTCVYCHGSKYAKLQKTKGVYVNGTTKYKLLGKSPKTKKWCGGAGCHL